MSQLLDDSRDLNQTSSASNQLIELVETYISHKRNRTHFETATIRKRLHALGYSEDQAQNLLIEMDDDADSELIAGIGKRKAKRNLIIGLIVALTCIVFFVAFAFGAIMIIILPAGVFATTMIAVARAYSEIGLVEKRKKRRRLKYQNWDEKTSPLMAKKIPNLSGKGFSNI